MGKRAGYSVARIAQIVLALAVVGGLITMLLPDRPHVPPSASAVEIARVPITSLAQDINGKVLKTGAIVLTGIGHYTSPASRPVDDVVVYLISRRGCARLFPSSPTPVALELIGPRLAGISPDGKNVLFGSTLALSSAHPAILCLRVDDGKLLWSKSYTTYLESSWRPFSDDGSSFVACRSAPGSSLWLYDSSTGRPLKELVSVVPGNVLRSFGFLPGSREVQYIEQPSAVSAAWRLWRVNVRSRRPRLITRFASSCDICPSSRGGAFAQVFVTGGRSLGLGKIRLPLGRQDASASVVLVDALGTKRRIYQSRKGEWIDSLKWSPDGKFVALHIRSEDGQWIDVVECAAGRTVMRLKQPSQDCWLLDWYPDSGAVLCAYQNETETVLQKLPVR